MSFGRLIFTAFSRNWLRTLFTLAAIVAAFCLFGALETIRYARDTPPSDADIVIVQHDGPIQFPPRYAETILALQGVRAAVGMQGLPAQNVKAPTHPLIIFGVSDVEVAQTFPGMAISPELAARWRQIRIGAICDARTAQEMGWKVQDRISIPLLAGMQTASGAELVEVILVGTYPPGLAVSGLLLRQDYFTELFPHTADFAFLFVRPTRASDARVVAQRIDQRFKTDIAPTQSAPLFDLIQLQAREAATVRLLIRGALAISFFTMVLIVTNALTQSARERIGELAVLQALGFRRGTLVTLVFAEAFALFAAGAVLGLALSNIGLALRIAGLNSRFAALPPHTLLLAVVCAAGCAAVCALVPSWELSKIRIAEALGRL